jgi:endonuclease/exonuclease/phosphatase family metal-dependent hydrolase
MAEPTLPTFVIEADRSVTFQVERAGARSVLVAGNFTEWGKAPLPLVRAEGTDRWSVRTPPLPCGVHAYKLIVDDQWLGDASNPLTIPDGFGGRNPAFVLGGQPLGSPAALRIASLNLHTYQEKSPLVKLERVAFAAAAMKIDLCLFQEVGEHVSDPALPNAGEVVRDHLQRFTGKPWYHAWREAHLGFDVYREGVSLLSSAPIEDLRVYRLSDKALGRIALVGSVTFGTTKLRVGSTHVSWEMPDGELEVAKLLAAIDAEPADGRTATLLAGDLNATAPSAPIRRFLDAGYADVGAARGQTKPTFLDSPQERIDYHFLRAAPGKGAPAVEAFARIFDGAPAEQGYQPRVSDHAGLVGAYRW